MPDIPTGLDVGSARTGEPGVFSTPNEFGAQVGNALHELGRDMEQGSRMTARAINRMENDKRVKQAYDDNRWAGEAYEQEKRVISEWMANPENHQKESFATDLDKFTKERLGMYGMDSAPSPRALDLFKQNFQSFANNTYIHALGTSAQNAVNNGIISVGTQIQDATNSYRNLKSINGDMATQSLEDSVSHIGGNIESNFRKLSPGIADKMHAELTTESVYASMADHPDIARRILDADNHIDEKLRKHLNDEIDSQLKVRDTVERESFNNSRQNNMLMAEKFGTGVKIPLSQYNLVYPADQGMIQKSRDDTYIDSMNSANSKLSALAPQEANYQLSELKKLRDGIKTTGDELTYNKVHQGVMANIQLQERNPVAWLQQNNPTVKNLLQRAIDAPADMQPGALRNLDDAVWKYQGTAPEGVSSEEKKQYLDKPINDRSVFSADDAQKTGADLNIATPQEFIKKMHDVMLRHPGHEDIAFNDLVKNGKLKQEYALAWQNKDQWWIDTYVGALKGGKGMEVPGDVEKTLQKNLYTDPTWLTFKSTYVKDSEQGAHEIPGFRTGIEQMSRALINQGHGPKEAVQKATSMLISETLGFTKVNGHPMMLLRDQGTGRLDDAHVNDIGRRLNVALREVDPREVNQDNFVALKSFGKDEMHLPRLQALRDQITARGFFQVNPDGKGATLYMMDENGFPFQVRDRQDRPFGGDFKTLPSYTRPTLMEFAAAAGGKTVKGTAPIPPQKTYDIKQYDWQANEGKPTYNWPERNSWIHRDVATD